MPQVELVYEPTCPYVEMARSHLRDAFKRAGLPPHWTEWNTAEHGVPAHARSYGSPTILVDGRDIAGLSPSEAGNCCRIYDIAAQDRGAPPLDLIVTALRAKRDGSDLTPLGSNVALLPSIGAALLPKLTCPACWPAYAGLLSSLGISFVDYTPYLLPLTAIFLAIALAALAYRASRRRGYAPFWLGGGAALAVLIGKFGFDSDAAMYAGLAALVVASAWNSWPMRRKAAACSACET